MKFSPHISAKTKSQTAYFSLHQTACDFLFSLFPQASGTQKWRNSDEISENRNYNLLALA
jgi:hypothetical protein